MNVGKKLTKRIVESIKLESKDVLVWDVELRRTLPP